MHVVDYKCMGMLGTVFGKMRVIRGQVWMVMHQLACILPRPDAQHCDQAKRANPGEDERSSHQSCPGTDPTCQRVSHKPTGMRQCELSGKDGATVFFTRRAVDDPANGGLRQGKAKTNNGPKRD